MQLRRAVPLSLVALLASAGCVSVAPQDAAPVPARGSVPPADAPELPTPLALPLGKLPRTADHDPDADPEQDPGPEPAPSPDRARAEAAPPRRARVPGPVTAHPRRRPAPPPRMDELCAAADGVVPPSIVDLCLRQYGR
ncbi:hypothetical protein PV721_30265 [Streptomyces sp. MB09-01]|uniref:hypothetical protein n=1 Tax=Streptomyces sp. MB09-01 TaxID=3028666 RepID=UPI0029A1A3E2|nr:hypothetical protein [Streptomyces sp. MB09-01]MDX3538558.1 hypothetical protein [Streptomyces sp. MB09-01]